jgi:NADH-quinone oxidoreductase subunit M
MLWMFQRVNYGEVRNERNARLPDLSKREWALMVPTIAMAVLMGVAPGIFLRPMEASVARAVDRVTGAQPATVRMHAVEPPGAPAARPAVMEREARRD